MDGASYELYAAPASDATRGRTFLHVVCEYYRSYRITIIGIGTKVGDGMTNYGIPFCADSLTYLAEAILMLNPGHDYTLNGALLAHRPTSNSYQAMKSYSWYIEMVHP